MRAAGCYQAHAVRYTGVRFARSAKYHTDTKDIKSKISLTHVDDLLADLPSDLKVVCVELVEGATPLPAFVFVAATPVPYRPPCCTSTPLPTPR